MLVRSSCTRTVDYLIREIASSKLLTIVCVKLSKSLLNRDYDETTITRRSTI